MPDDLRTVLIFAYECAPFNRRESTVGAQRPAQFAKHLPAFGWRAIVVCCDARSRGAGPTPDSAAAVERALNELPDSSESSIVPTWSQPYDGWLDRLWQGLGPDSRRWPGRDGLRRPLTALKLQWGDYSQGWQPVARAVAERIAKRVHIDACIGEHSPDAGVHLARWFSRCHDLPWIADFRDPILQPLEPLLRRLYAPRARRLVETASVVVNVTPYWSELDARELGRPTATIPNGYDASEFPVDAGRIDERLTIAYTGNLWAEMRPEIFFDGLARLRDRIGTERFARGVRFAYRGLATARVRELADRVGVSGVLDAAGYVPRHEALALLAGADALLLLGIPPEAQGDRYLARGIYPGKLFEYLGARRPILLVPGDQGQSEELLRRTRSGVALGSPDEIALWLEAALVLRENGEPLVHEPDESQRGQYARRALAGRMAALLDCAVESRGRPVAPEHLQVRSA